MNQVEHMEVENEENAATSATSATSVSNDGDGLGKSGAGNEAGAVDLQAELAAFEDRYLRLAAEFENYRKRTRDELMQSRARAQAAFLGSLLDVFDDMARVHAVDPAQATLDSVLEGMALVERKLNHVLEEAGVTWVDPMGAAFDPSSMDAVFRAPTDDAALDDTVAQVFQRGVQLGELLVRPARVSVFKAD
jgi:molecular chaperone GrpE